MTHFFSLGALSEKRMSSYFDLKIWVKFLFCQWLNFFLGQNDSFSLSVHEAKKISHFDLKNWVKF